LKSYNDNDFESGDERERIQNPPQTQQSQQQTHAVLQRKKPGKKPNSTSPALRKAQNRATRRAFRGRKKRHLHDLEDTIRFLRDKHQHEFNV